MLGKPRLEQDRIEGEECDPLRYHPRVGRIEARGDARPRRMITTEQSDRIRLTGDSGLYLRRAAERTVPPHGVAAAGAAPGCPGHVR